MQNTVQGVRSSAMRRVFAMKPHPENCIFCTAQVCSVLTAL